MEFREYKVGDILDIRGAKKSNREKDNVQNYPSICQSSENNGVNGWDSSYTEVGNVITMENNIKGKSFYQKYNFFIGKNITNSGSIITLKGKKDIKSENVGLYLVSVLDSNIYKYSYGMKRNMISTRNEIISLPSIIHDDGTFEPDWDYMENYISELKKKVNIYIPKMI